MKKVTLFLASVAILCCFSCSKNKEIENIELVIGQTYQGGIIAYIDETGEHGLIAVPQDQGTRTQWYNGSYYTITTETEIGTGKNNTARIVLMQGTGDYAAKLCDDLKISGYDDWFLPSKDELYLLYQNRDKIGGFSDTDIYWSSSERLPTYTNAAVWHIRFSDGYQDYSYKNNTYRVRAIRAF